jgi:hypothetical protein
MLLDVSAEPVIAFSPQDCLLCKAAPAKSQQRCESCGRIVAPECLIINVRAGEDVRVVTRDMPYYPSGSPMTGPTEWQGVDIIEADSVTQIYYADGRMQNYPAYVGAPADARKGECDHCRALRLATAAAVQDVKRLRRGDSAELGSAEECLRQLRRLAIEYWATSSFQSSD